MVMGSSEAGGRAEGAAGAKAIFQEDEWSQHSQSGPNDVACAASDVELKSCGLSKDLVDLIQWLFKNPKVRSR